MLSGPFLGNVGGLRRVATVLRPKMPRVLSIVDMDQVGQERVLQETSSILRAGGVVTIPTDTIYGVASLVSSNEGVERIYKMKGRQRDKPLAICVSNIDEIYQWGKVTVPSSLLSLLLPGPVTTIFERQSQLNPALNPGVTLVGLRIPDHQFVRRLVDMSGGPLALTSANISRATSTLSIREFQDLWPYLDLIIDGGTIGADGGAGRGGGGGEGDDGSSRLGSTVVDLSQSGLFTIIRPGMPCDRVCKFTGQAGGLDYWSRLLDGDAGSLESSGLQSRWQVATTTATYPATQDVLG